MLCHCWYFKDVGYKLPPYVCNGYHTVPIMAHELKYFAILNEKVLIIIAFFGVLVKWPFIKGFSRDAGSKLDDIISHWSYKLEAIEEK